MSHRGRIAGMVAALAAALVSSTASADALFLKNGNSFDGEVVEESTEVVTFDVPGLGAQKFPRSAIADLVVESERRIPGTKVVLPSSSALAPVEVLFLSTGDDLLLAAAPNLSADASCAEGYRVLLQNVGTSPIDTQVLSVWSLRDRGDPVLLIRSGRIEPAGEEGDRNAGEPLRLAPGGYAVFSYRFREDRKDRDAPVGATKHLEVRLKIAEGSSVERALERTPLFESVLKRSVRRAQAKPASQFRAPPRPKPGSPPPAGSSAPSGRPARKAPSTGEMVIYRIAMDELWSRPDEEEDDILRPIARRYGMDLEDLKDLIWRCMEYEYSGK